MTAKMTAVDWLESQINTWQAIADDETNLTLDTVRKLLQQAKAMEKEQIEKAFDKGLITENVYYGYDDKKAEQYYNKTFKSE